MPNQAQVLSVLKFILGLAGGWLIAKGWLTTDQLAELTAAALTVAGIVWSIVSNTHNAKLEQAKAAVRAAVPDQTTAIEAPQAIQAVALLESAKKGTNS